MTEEVKTRQAYEKKVRVGWRCGDPESRKIRRKKRGETRRIGRREEQHNGNVVNAFNLKRQVSAQDS